MNPQTIYRIFNNLRGTAKNSLLRSLDNEIATGVFRNSGYVNANQILNALRLGRLSSVEAGHFIRILMNEAGGVTAERIAKLLYENKSFRDRFGNLTEKKLRESLFNKGFTDDSIDTLIKTWKDEGHSFGTLLNIAGESIINFLNNIKKTKLWKTSPESFKRQVVEGAKKEGVLQMYKMLFRIGRDSLKLRPFKNITKDEAKKLGMWLISGIDEVPKDILNIVRKEGLVAFGGRVSSTLLKRWLYLSIFVASMKAVVEYFKERMGVDPKQYSEDDGFFKIAALRVWDNFEFANLNWVIPVAFFWNEIYPAINGLGSAILSNNDERIQAEMDNILYNVESTSAIPNSLKQQATDEQLSSIMMDNNGNWYLESARYPLRNLNGEWLVSIGGKWYKLSEIRKN